MSLIENDDVEFERVEEADSMDTVFIQLSRFPTPSEDHICTSGFLRASRGIVILIDLFGTLGILMRKDVQSNIDKLTAVYNRDPAHHGNLYRMLQSELPRGGVATESLLWLRRGLAFFCEFFELLRHDFENSKVKEDLKDNIKRAYDIHLRRHHNWFLQQTVRGLCTLAPKHQRLVQGLALGKANMEAAVYKTLPDFLASLQENLSSLEQFYRKHALDT